MLPYLCSLTFVSNDMLDKFVAYKDAGGIIRSLDFSDAKLVELPHSFMSKGNEELDATLTKEKRPTFPTLR